MERSRSTSGLSADDFMQDEEAFTRANAGGVDFMESEEGEEDPTINFTHVTAMTDLFSHVAAFASGGLNLSDPDNPVEVGYFDTVPFGANQAGFAGTWSNYPYFKSGAIGVTSVHEGLFLVKKRDKTVF